MAAFARPALHQQFGDEVVYVVPAAGEAAEVRTSCTCDLGPEEQVEVLSELGREWVTERDAIFSSGLADAVSVAIPATGTKHLVEIGTGDAMVVWTVERVKQKSGSMAVLRLRLPKMIARTRPNAMKGAK
jgi:hypothetical protein